MPKLSQIMGGKVRKEIPFYYQDNEGIMQEEKIKIYNLSKEQMIKLNEILEDRETLTDEKVYYFLINEITDLEVDYDEEEFVQFMKYYSDVFKAIETEFQDILANIHINGIDYLEKIFNMPENKRIKFLALNPKLKDEYDKYISMFGLKSKNDNNKEEVKIEETEEKLVENETVHEEDKDVKNKQLFEKNKEIVEELIKINGIDVKDKDSIKKFIDLAVKNYK